MLAGKRKAVEKMRKKLGLVVGVIGMVLFMFTVNANAIDIPGLLLNWKLDESSGSTASDSAGSNDGTLYNMEDADWISGVSGNGLVFDGVDEYIEAGSAVAVGTGDFSVDLWVDGTNLAAWDAVVDTVGHYARYMDPMTGWGLFWAQTGNDPPNADWGRFAWGVGDNHNFTFPIYPSTTTHVAAVIDRSAETVTIYMDGALQITSSQAGIGTANLTGSPLEVGWGKATTYAQMPLIDEIRIWTVALTPEQVEWMYNNPGQVPEPSALLLFGSGLLGLGIFSRRKFSGSKK